MTLPQYILTVVQEMEQLRPGAVCWAYLDHNDPRTNFWYSICISDVDWYLKDKAFKEWAKEIHQRGLDRYGQKLVFMACTPVEERLLALNDVGNLIMNV